MLDKIRRSFKRKIKLKDPFNVKIEKNEIKRKISINSSFNFSSY